ncbi:MAG: hypothetical protein IKW79_00660 [Schwartzia sp.]|nr:hypothetical protein [Schwartzia sp. (in: firmicutes)]
MAVPEGIPWMLVFTGIFVFLVLFVACIVLSIIVKDMVVRVGLVVAAVLLAGVMFGGAFLTMTGNEENETAQTKESTEPLPEAPIVASQPEQPQGDVVLVVDESTITEDFDALKTDRLSVEDPPKGKTAGKSSQGERVRVAKEIGTIEKELNDRLLTLDSQVQEVQRRFEAQEMDNYDMLFWQAKLKKQQYGFIVRAMDEKQKVMEKSSISKEEKAADIARIEKRRHAALEKWKEYHGVLGELTANQDVLRAL